MPEAKYETLYSLFEAIDSGDVDEDNLLVQVDNDVTFLYHLDGGAASNLLWRGDGYHDILTLWDLLLPKATVDRV